jgi:DNA polymerase-3 subunit alpha
VKETLPDIPEWSEQEILSREKATLGFYLTSHPLARYSDVITRFSNVSTDRLRDFEDGTEVSLGAMVSDIRYTFTRNGKSQGERMAIVKLEDLSGSCEAVFFPRELAKNEPLIRKDAVLFVRGAVSFRREPPSIKVSEVVTLSDAPQRLTESVTIRLEPRHQETKVMEELKQALKRHHGSCPVMLELIQSDGPAAKVRTDLSLSVTPDETFTDDVDRVLGAGHVVPNALKPRKQAARNGGRPWPRS